MDKWQELMGGRTFISDLGEEQTVTLEGKEATLGRYAVWAPVPGAEQHRIVEIGEDLDALMEKYHIPAQRVCALA